jgi:hypothetical protein
MSASPRIAKTDAASTFAIEARANAVDWAKVHTDLDAQGWSVTPKLMTIPEADLIAGLYHQ